MRPRHTFIYKNGLTLVLLVFFLASFSGQVFTGLQEYNNELAEYGRRPVVLSEYLTTGHLLQSTFENWESEFLQMGMYVFLTIWLRQIGSCESKDLDRPEKVDREPDPKRSEAPWPVRKGGLVLKIYRNSLSITFFLLFVLSFALHATGSLKNFNEEQRLKGQEILDFAHFMSHSRFWYESFQNWQSEFIAVLSIVVLSIYLRQYGSPESKPVDAPHSQTG